MTFTYEFWPFVDITLVQQNYLNFMRKYPLVYWTKRFVAWYNNVKNKSHKSYVKERNKRKKNKVIF